MANNDTILTIPILQNFDQTKQIGMLRINKHDLPHTPNYHFALGYRILNADVRENSIDVTEYELICVSLTPDKLFTDNQCNEILRTNNRKRA